MFITPITLFAILIIFFVASVIIATGAYHRGHSPVLFFIISMVLTPFVAAGFLWAMGSMDRDNDLSAIRRELKEIKEKLA